MSTVVKAIAENINRVIVGKEAVVQLLMVALVSEGHVLLEDVPGTGKTLLAKSLCKSLGLTFKRVQFTPDLLPSDVTGVSFYNQQAGEFEFRPGPAFANILLADEINRATPRTQSSLLECMEEHQITVDGSTYALPRPHMVVATQNPVELEGTFPLPEAQLDRFLLRLSLGYPSAEEELSILGRFRTKNPLDELSPVADSSELDEARRQAEDIHVAPDVASYILEIVRATRCHKEVRLGASPRGSLDLLKTVRSLALIKGRTYVLPDDVKELAAPVLAHRLLLSHQARLKGVTAKIIVQEIVDATPVPVGVFEGEGSEHRNG